MEDKELRGKVGEILEGFGIKMKEICDEQPYLMMLIAKSCEARNEALEQIIALCQGTGGSAMLTTSWDDKGGDVIKILDLLLMTQRACVEVVDTAPSADQILALFPSEEAIREDERERTLEEVGNIFANVKMEEFIPMLEGQGQDFFVMPFYRWRALKQ